MFPWEFHPAVVHFPLAFLLAAAAMDLWRELRGERKPSIAAAGLLVAGVVTGVISAALGAVAFYTVPAHTEEAHARMYWHVGFAAAALLAAIPIAIVRWRARHAVPAAWIRAGTMVTGVLIAVAGYLGGHLVLRGGAGVDPALLAAEIRHGHSHQELASEGAKPGTSSAHPEAPYPGALGAPVAPVASPSPTGHHHEPGAGPHHH